MRKITEHTQQSPAMQNTNDVRGYLTPQTFLFKHSSWPTPGVPDLSHDLHYRIRVATEEESKGRGRTLKGCGFFLHTLRKGLS